MQYTLKKSLGQHFLKDEDICKKIIDAVQKENPKHLLEVGPGGGALTKYLLQLQDVDLKAIELDKEKIDFLTVAYPAMNGKLIHESILDAELPFTQPFMIVGNFPYNISSQIVFKILDWKENVTCMVGMFQKEVAQRIVAKEGNKSYGILSVLVQAFFDTEYLFEVDENSFTPPPKVKSAVIKLKPVKTVPAMVSEKKFRILVKTAFNQRRKMLRNPLKEFFDTELLKEEIFTKRPEQLTVKQFADLTFKMK